MRTALTSFRYYLVALAAAVGAGYLCPLIAPPNVDKMLLSLGGGYLVGTLAWIGITLTGRGKFLWRLLLLWTPAIALTALLVGVVLLNPNDDNGVALAASVFMPAILVTAALCLLATPLLFLIASVPERTG